MDQNPVSPAMNSMMKVIQPMVHLMVASLLSYAAIMITFPFLVEILLGAICPGQNECSEVIFLLGALQLASGLGTVVMAPILGGISDDYGRKPVFVLIFFAAVLPQALLAYSRTRTFVYIWFGLFMIQSVTREGGFTPTLLASVADVVDHNRRSTAVGLTMASMSFGLLLGTVIALGIKTVEKAVLTAVILQAFSTVYLGLFFKETRPRQPFLPANESQSENTKKLLPKPEFKRQTANLLQSAKTVWSSRRLIIIAVVDFLNSFGITGMQSFALYYLKAVFDFGKNEYAILVLIAGVTAALGQMITYPVLTHLLGDRGVLWVGIVACGAHYFVYALAWAPWSPYVASALALFFSVVAPALGTMVSRGVDRDQQGKVQGFMGAVRSGAAILAPLTITPLTAAALGDNPPFGLRAFPFIICGSTMIVALFISIGLPPLPSKHSPSLTEYIHAPGAPEDFIHVTQPPEDLLHVPIHPETVDPEEDDERHVEVKSEKV